MAGPETPHASDAAPATERATSPRSSRRRLNPFVLVVSTVLVLGYAYLGFQLIEPLELPGLAGYSSWLVLALPFGMILWLPLYYWKLDEPTPRHENLLWLAFGSMALLSFLLFYVVLRDLLVLAARLYGVVSGAWGGAGIIASAAGAVTGWTAGPARLPQAFLDGRGSMVIFALTLVSLVVGYLGARRQPEITEVDVPIEGLPKALQGLRIVQISDLHIGSTIRRPFVEKVVQAANALKPDLIALTGDLVDGTVRGLAGHFEPLLELRAPLGRFYVTGNHEYYWEHEAWIRHASERGLKTLLNSHEVIERDGAKLVVAGVYDFWAARNGGSVASDPAAAIRGAPADAAVRILLAHQPKSALQSMTHGYDLQLSGHTHGGQFVPWTMAVKGFQPFVRGLYRVGRMWLYVNRGTGYWGPPMRLGSASEITLLRLVSA